MLMVIYLVTYHSNPVHPPTPPQISLPADLQQIESNAYLFAHCQAVEFVDLLVALVELLLDLVGTPRFFFDLPAALLDCVMVTRPFFRLTS